MSPRNVPRAESFFRGYGLQIVKGSRYLGVFFGTKEAQDSWMGVNVDGWWAFVDTLVGVACRYLQTAYAGLQKSLQQEWAFVQRVTPDIGMALQVAEDMLRDIFLPALFQGGTS